MIFFEHTVLDKESKIIEFKAVEDSEASGECTLVLFENYAEVTKASYKENKAYVLEGLLKAAFHFAGLKGYFMGRCNVPGIEFCLDRMNFEKTENGYENDIPSILMGSCRNCGK